MAFKSFWLLGGHSAPREVIMGFNSFKDFDECVNYCSFYY